MCHGSKEKKIGDVASVMRLTCTCHSNSTDQEESRPITFDKNQFSKLFTSIPLADLVVIQAIMWLPFNKKTCSPPQNSHGILVDTAW